MAWTYDCRSAETLPAATGVGVARYERRLAGLSPPSAAPSAAPTAAGVKVALDKVTATDFFGPSYLKWTFAQDFWGYYGNLPQVGFATLPASPYNETHWDDPRYIALYTEALATVDDAKRTEIAHELQRIDYESGGYIIPYFPPLIDGHTTQVQGLAPAKVGRPLFNYDFKILWLT